MARTTARCARPCPALVGSPAGTRQERALMPRSAPLPGHVVARRLLKDDVQPVVEVDGGDEADQRRELVVVVVLGGGGPRFVGDATGGVGDARALLGEPQRG